MFNFIKLADVIISALLVCVCACACMCIYVCVCVRVYVCVCVCVARPQRVLPPSGWGRATSFGGESTLTSLELVC